MDQPGKHCSQKSDWILLKAEMCSRLIPYIFKTAQTDHLNIDISSLLERGLQKNVKNKMLF